MIDGQNPLFQGKEQAKARMPFFSSAEQSDR
jgi:hypothetical protein